MNLLEKIEYLDRVCDGTLDIFHAGPKWSIHSYGRGTPLEISGLVGWVYDDTLEKTVDTAIAKFHYEFFSEG